MIATRREATTRRLRNESGKSVCVRVVLSSVVLVM